jgi:hypothetical protein
MSEIEVDRGRPWTNHHHWHIIAPLSTEAMDVPGGVLVKADGSLVLVPDAAVCARWVLREIEADEAEGDEARRVLHREITLRYDGYSECRGFSFGRWMPIDDLPEMTPEILEMLASSNAETKP